MGAAPGNRPLAFRAALSRILIALLFLTLQPLITPSMTRWWWVFAIYLVSALIGQYMIWKGVGGQARALGFGLVDIAVISFIVSRLGSLSTVFTSLYIFLGIVNALVVRRWVAMALALLASLAYAAVLAGEWQGWLPHAPDVAIIGTSGEFDGREAIASWVTVSVLLAGTTAVVSRLVIAIRERELQLIRANQQLEELSQRDPLTQLYNRRYLLTRLEVELARVRRGHPLALLLVDLDHFKAVNDTQGHLEGDAVLRRVAAALERATREIDIAGRFGGDEFVVVLPDTDAAQAAIVAERLIAEIRVEGRKTDADAPVTASVGLSTGRPGDNTGDILRRADEAAYRAKADGGNRLDGNDAA